MIKQSVAAQNNIHKVQYIECQDIRRHPLDVSIPIKKQVELYKKMAESIPNSDSKGGGGGGVVQELPIVKVGKVTRGKVTEYFLLADVDVYLGVMEAAEAVNNNNNNSSKVMLKCQVETFSTITDFLIQHVQYNNRPTGFNPLLMRRVAAYIVEHNKYGKDANISELFGLTNTVNQKFLTVDITEEAITILTELCELLAANLSQFILPYYIPHTISKRERRLQGMIAEGIVSLVRVRPISDARFAWPGPEEIDTMINSLKQGEVEEEEEEKKREEEEKQKRAKEKVKKEKQKQQKKKEKENGTLDDDGDDDEKKESGQQQQQQQEEEDQIITPRGEKKPSAAAIRKSKEIIKTARNVLVIPKGSGHPAYVVDHKAKRVSAVVENRYHKIIKLDDVGASTPYIIPQAAEEWLGLSPAVTAAVDDNTIINDKAVTGGNELTTNTKDIKMATFENILDIEKFAKKQNKYRGSIRGVIFYK